MVQPASKRLVTEATVAGHVATQITTPGTATATALNATYAGKSVETSVATKAEKADVIPKWKATTAYTVGDKVVSPNGDIVTAAGTFTSGATYDETKWNLSTTYSIGAGSTISTALQPKRTKRTMLQTFQTGHGFNYGPASGSTGNTNNTSGGHALGTQCVTISPASATNTDVLYKYAFTPWDFTGKDAAVLIKVDNADAATGVDFQFLTGPDDLNAFFTTVPGQMFESGKWVWVTLPFGTKSGTANRASIQTMKIYFKRKDAATPVTYSLQAIAAQPISPAFTKGAIVFDFDDGPLATTVERCKVLAKYDYPANHFPVTKEIQIGTSTTVTKALLREAQDTFGHLVGSHADTWDEHNQPVIEKTAQQIKDSQKRNRDWLSANGFKGGDYYAYPGGNFWQGAMLDVARTYYALGRAAGMGMETLPPADWHKLRVTAIGDVATPIATAKALVDQAYNSNQLCIFVLHVDYSLSNFTQLVDYIAAKGDMPVLNYAELFKKLSND